MYMRDTFSHLIFNISTWFMIIHNAVLFKMLIFFRKWAKLSIIFTYVTSIPIKYIGKEMFEETFSRSIVADQMSRVSYGSKSFQSFWIFV